MANLVGSFREALAADLAVQFPDADVSQGERTGAATDRAKLTIVWGGTSEQGDQVVVAEARFFVRYWPKSPKLRDDAPGGVRDPGELEQAAWDLASFLRAKQTAYSSSGAWFSRLMRVTPDYDPEEWGVEAELLVVFDNPAVIA